MSAAAASTMSSCYVSFKCSIISLSGPFYVKLYNLLASLFLCKVYNMDCRIHWEIHENDSCKLLFQDIITNSYFKGKILTTFIPDTNKSYYYNRDLPLRKLLCSVIPTNQIKYTGDNVCHYNNVPVIVYDYYIMNRYTSFIPDVFDYIVPESVYMSELSKIQSHLDLHSNIQGFYNLYKNKSKDHFVIGLYISDKVHPISVYISKLISVKETCELAKNQSVMFYIAFHENLFSAHEITENKTLFQKAFDDRVLFYNHLHGEGNLYSVMNLLCLQDVEVLVMSSSSCGSISRMLSLRKPNQLRIEMVE
jgi:hypothetical protein